MCRSKMSLNVSEPIPKTPKAPPTPLSPIPDRQSPGRPSLRSPVTKLPSKISSSASSTSAAAHSSGSASAFNFRLDTSVDTASASSRTSLSSLHLSLPENAYIYDFSEIRSATNNFLAKRYSTATTSSSQSWRCSLHGKDVIIFQRKIQRTIHESELKSRLSILCRSHHGSIIKLLGASISNDYIYLVYEFLNGTNLAICLRNPINPNFTVLSTWMSRMQIATNLADSLNYIHNTAGFSINLVHKHVKSSAIIISEPSLGAKICHFGAAELCGETDRKDDENEKSAPELGRLHSRGRQFEGVRGYMSPEFQTTGLATQKSDVYAFGVIVLELLTGEEPVKFKYDKTSGEYRKISVIETARATLEGGRDGGEGVESRLRSWVDKRLRDSFPVEVAERITRLALECVHVEANERPDMRRVVGKISKLYLESKKWTESVKLPTNFTFSLAPR